MSTGVPELWMIPAPCDLDEAVRRVLSTAHPLPQVTTGPWWASGLIGCELGLAKRRSRHITAAGWVGVTWHSPHHARALQESLRRLVGAGDVESNGRPSGSRRYRLAR